MESLCSCFSELFRSSGGTALTRSTQPKFVEQLAADGVKISADGRTVSGKGTVLVNVPLHQDQVHWEIKLVKLPQDASELSFRIGVSRKIKEALENKLGEIPNTWGLKPEETTLTLKEGDVIGVSYDQSSGRPMVFFSHNGEKLPTSTIKGISGLVCPAVTVMEGVELEGCFAVEPTDFQYPPPNSFMGIIPPRSLV